MRLILTGATGFLGRHLLTVLENHPDVETIYLLLQDPHRWQQLDYASLCKKTKIIVANVTDDPWHLSEHFKNEPIIDVILHAAALVKHQRKDVEYLYQVNVQGSVNMLNLAGQVGARMIFISSSGTVGCFDDFTSVASETSAYAWKKVAHWPYYNSKIEAEKKLIELAHRSDIDLSIIRPPVMLGPGDHRFRTLDPICKFLKKQLPFLLPGSIHFVDIRDVAKALLRLCFLQKPKLIYHLPGKHQIIADFFRDIAVISGIRSPQLIVPKKMALLLCSGQQFINKVAHRSLHLLPDAVVVEMACSFWGLSSQYAEEDLGFSNRDFQETLMDTVYWLNNTLR